MRNCDFSRCAMHGQWWQAVCEAAGQMGFAWVCAHADRRRRPRRNGILASVRHPAGRYPAILRMTVPCGDAREEIEAGIRDRHPRRRFPGGRLPPGFLLRPADRYPGSHEARARRWPEVPGETGRSVRGTPLLSQADPEFWMERRPGVEELTRRRTGRDCS